MSFDKMETKLEQRVANEFDKANEIINNPLIAYEIWKFFDVQDLLQTSLVCKLFCSISRKFLRNSPFCSIQLNANPCRALQTVNNLLETSTDVCYTGICHKRKLFDDDHKKWYLPYACDDNCLANQLGDTVNVRQLYSSVLEKMEFRLVCFRPKLNKNCPFLRFIEIVLTDRANEIRELRACGRTLERNSLPDDWKDWRDFCDIFPFSQPLCFPNLKILKIPVEPNIATKLINSAPKLTKIIGYLHRGAEPLEMLEIEGKESYLTNLIIIRMDEIQHLTNAVKPKIEKLFLVPLHTEEEFAHVEIRMSMFSHMIHRYLRRLNCSIYTLNLLANAAGMIQFHSVKSVKLFNDWLNINLQEAISSLKSVEFKSSFPSVEIICLQDKGAIGPPLRTLYPPKQDFRSYSAISLTLFLDDFDTTPNHISNIFPNVKNLKLDYFTRCNLPHLLEINPEWRGLEKLKLIGRIEDLQLDGLFRFLVEHKYLPSVRERSGSTDNVLHRMQLNTLTISAGVLSRPPTCYVQGNVDNYLVSQDVAELIATNLPGFTLQLKMEFDHRHSTSFHPNDYDFDHIKPYAKIWMTSLDGNEDRPESLYIWNFVFEN